MLSNEIRNKFIDFFKVNKHQHLPSSGLVPQNDPTLLFTNAGMVQFKDVFTGSSTIDCQRACTSQKCIRAGGKHNDLEQVGHTLRHHTFFEMLGNFSFGDYFKEEAIRMAWKFLTVELRVPVAKLIVTIHDSDDEAYAIWHDKMNVSPDKIIRCGDKDNFWSMGATGPCGPCTEIFYDHGEQYPGGPPGSEGEDLDRFVEIWNLVFMQYNRDQDGTMHKLPKPSVDTGMGLERLSAVLQGTNDNYNTDLFAGVMAKAADLGVKDVVAQKVIADHIRSCAFLITDGVLPSNEGRGYVLRRIIRRAVRHGYQQGIGEIFFYKMLDSVQEQMGGFYPELYSHAETIRQALATEEELFRKTISQGMTYFADIVKGYADGQSIPGEMIFKLYDTYGFPVDLCADLAKENGLSLDYAAFDKCMAVQKQRSRAAQEFGSEITNLNVADLVATDFTGYSTQHDSAKIIGIYAGDGKKVRGLSSEQEPGIIVVNKTPFYAESGGQIGDKGIIRSVHGSFNVATTKKIGDIFIHLGVMLNGKIALDDAVELEVDGQRSEIAIHHSATHLLHAALRQVLGQHVEQKGSLVEATRLRFDYTHSKPMDSHEQLLIEDMVNSWIRSNWSAETKIMSPQEAKAEGAMALFGEKYGNKVRVLSLGPHSLELCGGTHVKATGDCGYFIIVKETGVAQGIRRIEAFAGQAAHNYLTKQRGYLAASTALFNNCQGADLADKINGLQTDNRENIRKLKIAGSRRDAITPIEYSISKGVKLQYGYGDNLTSDEVGKVIDRYKANPGHVVVIVNLGEKGASIVVGCSRDIADKVAARSFIEALGGRGGGRPDFAQGRLVQELGQELTATELQKISTLFE